jgi:hypothetical protein
MEGAAALFNDCLLALDEISECDPREVGNIVYSLGNGRGKQRAGRTGAARAVTRWQAFIVSTGERTIATTMAEGGHRFKGRAIGSPARYSDGAAAWLFRRAARSRQRGGAVRCDQAGRGHALRATGPGVPGAADARSTRLRGAAGDPQGLARLQPPRLSKGRTSARRAGSRCSRWPANWRPNTG